MLPKIVRNSDLIVGMALALAVSILGVVGVATPTIVSAAILALLALLAGMLLRLREGIEQMRDQAAIQAEALSAVSASLDGQHSASKLFVYDYPDIAKEIQSASDIYVIAGGSLRTTLGAYVQQFSTAIQAGARVRLACPDPANKSLMNQLAMTTGETPIDIRQNIEANLRLTKRLQSAATPSIEVRVLSHIPTVGQVYIRTDLPLGAPPNLLLVKILPFGRVSGAAPVLRLERASDGPALDGFAASAEEIWESGQPWVEATTRRPVR